MSDEIHGPFEERIGPDGSIRPFFVVPFDKEGRPTAPETVDALLEAVASGEFTDVIVFSHGWNNDWQAASGRYRGFMEAMEEVRRQYAPRSADTYRPLLVGVFWPSTALVMPWERGPRFAGARGSVLDEPLGRELVEGVAEGDREELQKLLAQQRLGSADATRLAELLASALGPFSDPEELQALWRRLEADLGSGIETEDDLVIDEGFVDAPPDSRPSSEADGPRAAGRLDARRLDPRHAYRLLTVWQMKDRAGVVGERGLAPLLADLQGRTDARLHLVGHSFGARVVLSAVASGEALRVRSMLLLQPAVSAWCFADRVPGTSAPGTSAPGITGASGGYRSVLDRVELPVLTTFSRQDRPLHKFFHLALRRRRDLGEVRMAASGVPRYAALGGFGPQGLGDRLRQTQIPLAGEAYPATEGAAVLALEGHERIHGHGDVVSPLTAWALCSLVDAPGP